MPLLLEVRNLAVSFEQPFVISGDGKKNKTYFQAIQDLSFELTRGQTLGVIGESGSGKSVLSLAIMGLLPAGVTVSGEIRYDGVDLLKLNPGSLRAIRGRKIAMIFQEPMTALNPTMKVGRQIAEVTRLHRGISRAAAQRHAIELLGQVGIEMPAARSENYPFELSGGMRQRVMIAMAIAAEPDLLIADEPTTALDVTTQAQILKLLKILPQKPARSLILVTHDLAVASGMVDQILVMQNGRKIEQGPRAEVLGHPRQEHTQKLIATQLEMSAWSDL